MRYDSHTGFPAIPKFRPCGRLGSFEGGGGSSRPTDYELARALLPKETKKKEKQGHFTSSGSYTKKASSQNAAHYSGSGPAASQSSGIGDSANKSKKKSLV